MKIRLLGGEVTVTGKKKENNEKDMGLTRERKARSLEGQNYREGARQRRIPQVCAPAVQMVCVKLPHPAHHFACKKQKEAQVLHNLSKQNN